MSRRKKELTGNARVLVAHVTDGMNDVHVFVGPLVWRPSDGTKAKQWYFVVATSEAERGFRCDQIVVEDETDRYAFLFALTSCRPNGLPLVIHDMDDELNMACYCEALWPGERIRRIRASLEAERKVQQQ